MTVPGFDGQGEGWVTDPADPRLGVLWPGSRDYLPEDLGFPLYVARIQVERFAPALFTQDVPEHYVAGQILQARNLIRAGVTGDQGGSGGYEQVVTAFPLDWTVKQLLRPRRGLPYFGQNRNQEQVTP